MSYTLPLFLPVSFFSLAMFLSEFFHNFSSYFRLSFVIVFHFLSFSSLSFLLFSVRCSNEFSFFPTFIFPIAFSFISISPFVIS